MRRAAWLQETQMERFEESFGPWTESRLTQEEAAVLVARAPRRGTHRNRREAALRPGMQLHQDGNRHEWGRV